MCVMCQELDPSVTDYDPHVEDTLTDGGVEANFSSGADLANSLVQFVDYLTEGFGGEAGRDALTFDVQADGTITIGFDGVDGWGDGPTAEALQAWSAMTGLTFSPFDNSDGDASPSLLSILVPTIGGESGFPSAGSYDFETLIQGFGSDSTLAGTEVYTGATAAAKPVYSVDQIADYLADGFWQDNNQQMRSFNVQTGGTITVNINGLDSLGKATALQALEAWTAVTGITFAQASNAMITFDDNQSGAYNSSSTSGNTIIASNVNVHTSWQGYGDYYFQTYIHEIGHAMGLGHGGMYNGSADFNTQAHYANDSWQMSVMSYFSNNENPNVSASFAYLATAQLADIAAIQTLYGAPVNVETGNSIYGDNTNVSQYGMGLNTGKALTIFDSGGTDTIDLASRSYNQRIDLYAEHFSDMNGKTGNLAIARDTVIENLRTGSGTDYLTGNVADNTIESGAGNDTILGEGGNDVLVGGAGADTLSGGTGGDTFVYGAVADAGDTITDFDLAMGDRIDLSGLFTALGYAGSDPIGDNMVWLSAATGGSWLMVNGGGYGTLAMVFLAGIAASASVADIIDVASVPVGPDPSAYDTTITLTNDYVPTWTESGSIIRDTNGGTDTLDLSAVTYNCKIYLDGSMAGKVGSKALMIEQGSDIENLLLGSGSDYGYGNALDNLIDGAAGNDNLFGYDGDDTLIGGDGNDKLYGHAGADTMSGDVGNDTIYGGSGDDGIQGGEGNDKLYGDDGADTIAGDIGNDTIYGGFGDDGIEGGEGNDKLYGDDGVDVIVGGAGTDKLYGGTGNDDLDGGDDADKLYGEDGDDTLTGGGDKDSLYGGLGNDTLDGGDFDDRLYGDEGDDILIGWHGKDSLYGDIGNDTMYGDGGADKLYGGDGNDEMSGGNGNDYLKGDDGDDILDAGDGIDKLYGGDGNDWLDSGDGNDMLYGDNGDDVMYAGAGDDKLYGKLDNDTMYGGDGLDYIKGDKGNDFADGGAGDDKIYGDNGTDEIYGGAGLDYIKGGNDADYIDGGADNDKIYGDNGTDEIYGGEGDDYIKGGNDADYIDGGAGIDKIYGDNGDDVIYGGEGDDYIKAGNDNDFISGGDGSDTLYGDNGLDVILAGAGDDYVKAGNQDDEIYGADGNDTIYGDSGNDLIEGGAGDDIIDGGNNDDIIIAGLGADTIKGGGGADVFVFTSLDDAGDYVSDFKITNGDQISVTDLLNGGTVADALANDLFALVADEKSSWLTFDTGTEVIELAYLYNVKATTEITEDWLI